MSSYPQHVTGSRAQVTGPTLIVMPRPQRALAVIKNDLAAIAGLVVAISVSASTALSTSINTTTSRRPLWLKHNGWAVQDHSEAGADADVRV